MPLPRMKVFAPKRYPPGAEEKPEPAADLPGVVPDDEEQARPYQDYVDSEARKYWQETAREHNLTKPSQQAIRAAAMAVLCRARRRKTGRPPLYRAHLAVIAMQSHALEQGLIQPPYSRLETCPDYLEALIQLADDAGWLAREIPLPDHPPPKHPPIRYVTNPKIFWPVPTADSLIRGDYVHTPGGMPITEAEYIHPWIDPVVYIPGKNDIINKGWDACYTLFLGRESSPAIMFHWIKRENGVTTRECASLKSLKFSPNLPPVPASCVIL